MTTNVELVIVALICFHLKAELHTHTSMEDNNSQTIVSTKNKTKARLHTSSNSMEENINNFFRNIENLLLKVKSVADDFFYD